jgi:predicted metal-binding membrane protein
MSGSGLEGLLRRDRVIVFLALIALTALAWTYVLWLAGNMSAAMPAMAGMNMGPAIKPWSVTQFLVSFAMWAMMMVGMMTPAATPIILLYAHVGRQAQADGKPFAPAGWFGAGYLIAWCGFAGLASLAQGVLIEAALLTPKLDAASDLFGGVVLIVAGLYQWTPLKESCLSQCQATARLYHASWRLQARRLGFAGARPQTRAFLPRLLLGSNDAAFCRRRDESAVDRRPRDLGSFGENRSGRKTYVARPGLGLGCGGGYISL